MFIHLHFIYMCKLIGIDCIRPPPALDRHARVQPDTQTSATRLPGRLHQRQQRWQHLLLLRWRGWGGEKSKRRRKRRREEGEESFIRPWEQGGELGWAFRWSNRMFKCLRMSLLASQSGGVWWNIAWDLSVLLAFVFTVIFLAGFWHIFFSCSLFPPTLCVK